MKYRIAIVFLLLSARAYAACSGASPNLTASTWADLAACHAIAAQGDRITVSPGSYIVTTSTSITKNVSIAADGVTVTDNTNGLAGEMITFTESTAGSIRLNGLTVRQGTGVHQNTFGVIGIDYAPNGKPVIITGVNYHMAGTGGNFFYVRTNRGLLSGNNGYGVVEGPQCFNNSSYLRHKWTGGGIDAWKTPGVYGSADVNGDQALYVEDFIIRNMLEAYDGDDNARTVLRHGTVVNSGLILHGTDTSGIIGARLTQISYVTFVRDLTPTGTCSDPQMPVNMNGFIGIRGGTALIHHNEIPNVQDGWWGDKAEVAFWYENIRRRAGGYPCWSTTTAPGAGYPAPHIPGWGFTAGGTNPGGLGSNVLQDLEPIRLWGNTGTGNHDSPAIMEYPNECGSGAPSVVDYIKPNREYYLSAPANFSSYVYPHPLVNGSTPTPVPAPVPTPTPTPEPIPNAAPTVTLKAPASGQLITTKTFTISVAASDDTGVAWLELSVNNQVVKAGAFSTMTYSWNTAPYKGKGLVTIRAVAKDAEGLTARNRSP
jgi:hypothetical protein